MKELLHSGIVVGILFVYGLLSGTIGGVCIGWFAHQDWEMWLKIRRKRN